MDIPAAVFLEAVATAAIQCAPVAIAAVAAWEAAVLVAEVSAVEEADSAAAAAADVGGNPFVAI